MDELKSLILKKGEVDENLLTKILRPFLMIEEETGQIIFKSNFKQLDKRRQVIIFLLATKAHTRLGYSKNEHQKPKQLETSLAISGGTIRPVLRVLKKRGLVVATSEGKYYIPTSLINIVNDFLKLGGGEQNGS